MHTTSLRKIHPIPRISRKCKVSLLKLRKAIEFSLVLSPNILDTNNTSLSPTLSVGPQPITSSRSSIITEDLRLSDNPRLLRCNTSQTIDEQQIPFNQPLITGNPHPLPRRLKPLKPIKSNLRCTPPIAPFDTPRIKNLMPFRFNTNNPSFVFHLLG